VIDKITNKNIINVVAFPENLFIESYNTGQNLSIDFFSSRSYLGKYIPTLSFEADKFIDKTTLSFSFWTKTNTEQRTRKYSFISFFTYSKEILFHTNVNFINQNQLLSQKGVVVSFDFLPNFVQLNISVNNNIKNG